MTILCHDCNKEVCIKKSYFLDLKSLNILEMERIVKEWYRNEKTLPNKTAKINISGTHGAKQSRMHVVAFHIHIRNEKNS